MLSSVRELPRARFTVRHAKGIGANTELEAISSKTVVATVTFKPLGRSKRTAYKVVCSPATRRMALVGPPATPFTLYWGL